MYKPSELSKSPREIWSVMLDVLKKKIFWFPNHLSFSLLQNYEEVGEDALEGKFAYCNSLLEISI